MTTISQKITTIDENAIDVVATGFNGGSGDSIVLLLEGPCGVDEDVRSTLSQKSLEIPVVGVDGERVLRAETEPLGGLQRALATAAAYQQPDGWIFGKACANVLPEKSVPAQNQNRVQPDPSRVIAGFQGGK
ncbi:MAG TPA: hypothetical protein VGG63_18095 [Steroidobacteraceae bacterium]